LNETKVKTQNKSSHQYSNHSKYKSIVTYESQGTMLLYDRSIVLDSCEYVKMSRSKFIVASFNINIHRAIHIIVVYKPPSLSLTIFLSTLQELISKSPTICPIVVLRDFNEDVLFKKTSEVRHLLEFMTINKMKLQFQESTTIYGSQLDHIWSNNPSKQCISGTTKVFWTDHKPIHFAFKLPNHVP
jgi:hypothetical protein